MINLPAWETFSKYDKKSLMAGIVVGQGLKGRARAPQTPTPAGFPQGLWDDAMERANAMIASIKGAAQSATPGTPNDWQFDKDAFCFGIAAGRSLEGWEIDGALNLPDGWAMIIYYIHVDEPCTVKFNILVSASLGRRVFTDWGDESTPQWGAPISFTHDFQPGDYATIIVSLRETNVEQWEEATECLYGAFFAGNITRIGVEAFGRGFGSFPSCRNLQFIELSQTCLSYIGENAFNLCTSLTSVTLPDSVTFINWGAFSGCTSLESITIPDGVTSILLSTFQGCKSLTSVTIPDSVTRIGSDAFYGCSSLQSITIPNSVTFIDSRAFSRCTSLKSVTISDGVTDISMEMFSYCTSLKSVTIPDGVTRIHSGAFFGCTSLESVTIPNSVTNIIGAAFSSCTSLESITIPDGVTRIGTMAFEDCTSLKSITIPNSVTYIGYRAFNHTALKSITINRNATVGSNAFPGDCEINYYD